MIVLPSVGGGVSGGGLESAIRGVFGGGVQGVWYDPSDIDLSWRRNLLTYTEQFDNAVWTKTGLLAFGSGSVVNATTAPDGTTTADLLVEDTSTGAHQCLLNIGTAIGRATYSVYLKAYSTGAVRYGVLQSNSTSNTNNAVFINLATGEITQTIANSITNISVTAAANGWWRVQFSDASIGIAAPRLIVGMSDTATGNTLVNTITGKSYIGDGISGIYVWGAQLEIGSSVTSYQRITDAVQDYYQYKSFPTMFQDSAGSLPTAQVEQTVGLILDKSKNLVLGNELVTNGTFDTGITGWSAVGAGTVTWDSNGYLSFYNSAASQAQSAKSTAIAVESGKTYKFTFSIKGDGTAKANFYASAQGITIDKVNSSASLWETYSFIKTATSSGNIILYLLTDSKIGNAYLDNVSVKELSGNHAYQTTPNSRPYLRARHNRLTYSEQFDNAAWSKYNLNMTGTPAWVNVAVAPDGTLSAEKLISSNSTDQKLIAPASLTASAATYTYSVYMKAAEFLYGGLSLYDGTSYFAAASFNLSTGVVETTFSGSAAISNLGNGWFRCSITGTAVGALQAQFCGIRVYSSAPVAITTNCVGDGTSGIYIWGADLRLGSDAGTYQRTTATAFGTTGTLDYDPVGQKPYLWFDGIDDSLSTNNIDFSAGDKMFVSAGITKFNDTAIGMVTEFSTVAGTSAGAFALRAPYTAGTADYGFQSTGTTSQNITATSYASPITNVVTGLGDISAPSATLRVNGTQVGQITSSQGTGNYGNYPLFIGRRNNSSIAFNGLLYNLIVAGKTLSSGQVTQVEKYVGNKTGVTI